MAPQIHIPEQKHITIRQQRDRVLLIVDGKTILDMPWDAAQEIIKLFYIQAKKAEEYARAEQIVADQAILTRAGFPIGLSNNRDILEEAANEAAWNSALRRYMPLKGIRSGESFGTPALKSYPPAGGNDGKDKT